MFNHAPRVCIQFHITSLTRLQFQCALPHPSHTLPLSPKPLPLSTHNKLVSAHAATVAMASTPLHSQRNRVNTCCAATKRSEWKARQKRRAATQERDIEGPSGVEVTSAIGSSDACSRARPA
jgi:hypothetical protein